MSVISLLPPSRAAASPLGISFPALDYMKSLQQTFKESRSYHIFLSASHDLDHDGFLSTFFTALQFPVGSHTASHPEGFRMFMFGPHRALQIVLETHRMLQHVFPAVLYYSSEANLMD
jgi:hypothetical protein